jgi:hypothetical protein
VSDDQQRWFRTVFIALQVLVVGMLISFPLQGYGFYSILLSTLHTLLSLAFITKFFISTKPITSISLWFARAALIFFALSTIGPFSLGYLMSAGLGQSKWYYFSIYFYLHFQYNGFFLFGIFSLMFALLERRGINFNATNAKSFGWLLALACVPAYLLSTLWTQPGYSYNALGGVAAFVQLIASIVFLRLFIGVRKEIVARINKSSIFPLLIVLTCFFIKSLLQLISSLPSVAQMAYELRPVTIAYLHLVLVGVISLFVLVWYIESSIIDKFIGKTATYLFIFAFVGMEICIVLYPWWTKTFGRGFPAPASATFLFSALLSISCLIFLVGTYRQKS